MGDAGSTNAAGEKASTMWMDVRVQGKDVEELLSGRYAVHVLNNMRIDQVACFCT